MTPTEPSPTRLAVRIFAGIASTIILGVGGIYVLSQQGGETRQRAEANRAIIMSNRQALRVGCFITVNLIRQSGVAATSSGASASATERRAALRLSVVERVVLRAMTSAERAEDRRLTRTIDRYGGGKILVPDCDEVVRHPERVKLIERADAAP